MPPKERDSPTRLESPIKSLCTPVLLHAVGIKRARPAGSATLLDSVAYAYRRNDRRKVAERGPSLSEDRKITRTTACLPALPISRVRYRTLHEEVLHDHDE